MQRVYETIMQRGVRPLLGGFLLAAAAAFPFNISAQCDGERYREFVFSSWDVESDVQYGANLNSGGNMQNLFLDVYTPEGDSETDRPLIIVAHGGSFVAGSKTGNDVVPLCQDFARLGYVAASIQYRLGATDPGQFIPTPNSVTKAVWRAVHDARAAIRFFRKSAEEDGNPYGINPDKVFMVGVSAGGFMALHAGFLNSLDEVPEGIDMDAPGLDGGLEGNSGNAGYSSELTAIVNIAGAIGDTTWMQANETPVLSFHGDEDGTVPYGSETLVFLGFINLIPVDGSASIQARAENIGLTACLETHEGFDHVPHSTNSDIYDTTIVISRNWLYHFVCDAPLTCEYGPAPIPTSVDEVVAVGRVKAFPNPVRDHVNVDLSELGAGVHLRLFNTLGALVFDYGIQNADWVTLHRQGLPAGMYLLEVTHRGERNTIRLIMD